MVKQFMFNDTIISESVDQFVSHMFQYQQKLWNEYQEYTNQFLQPKWSEIFAFNTSWMNKFI